MHALLVAPLALAALTLSCRAGDAPLVEAAAVLVFSTPDPANLTLTPEGTVRFAGPVPGTVSELVQVPSRACAFQSRALPEGRTLFQVNLAAAERDYTVRPSQFGFAAIRIVGRGVYCDRDGAGQPACRDVYDVTAWGELDLRRKIASLRRLAEAGCFR